MRLLAASLTFLVAGSAWAEDGNSVLKKLDEATNRFDDLHIVYDVVDEQPGKDPRMLGFEVNVRGEKRFTAFTAPADLKGTRVLVLSQTQMYIYLPSFRKVRRIASHVTKQGFMGTTFSNDDMALNTLADKYTGKLVDDGKEVWTVEASASGGGTAPYDKIVVKVRKKDHLPLQYEYWNGGKKLKTETRTNYACEGNICLAEVHKMVDHTQNDRWSKLVRKSWKVNPKVPSRVFSKRNLSRGR